MSQSTFLPALRLVRRPGEFGPILDCSGELSVTTAEALKQELDLLLPLGHHTLTVNLSTCSFLDGDGLLILLETLKQMSEEGRRLVVVAGTGWMARLLKVVGIDHVLPVFPDEEAAVRTLRGGGPLLPAPTTWAAAKAATVAYWRVIQEALGQAPPEEVLRQLTSMTALCDRAEKIFQDRPAPAAWRCQSCPLFHALGGRPIDVGCRGVRDPIITAVRAGDLALARAEVDEVIRLLEEMPLPESEASAPGTGAEGGRAADDVGT